MVRNFTLEYWEDDGWFVGRLREIPGVFSQGETLEELERNICDAYHMLMAEEDQKLDIEVHTKEIGVEV